METGKLSLDDLATRIQALKERKKLLEKSREELSDNIDKQRQELIDIDVIKEHVGELKELLDETNAYESRRFIKSFVKEIEVSESEAILKYTLPMRRWDTQSTYPEVLPIVPCGGAEGTRTPDPLHAKQVLSQLSYSPIAD